MAGRDIETHSTQSTIRQKKSHQRRVPASVVEAGGEDVGMASRNMSVSPRPAWMAEGVSLRSGSPGNLLWLDGCEGLLQPKVGKWRSLLKIQKVLGM